MPLTPCTPCLQVVATMHRLPPVLHAGVDTAPRFAAKLRLQLAEFAVLECFPHADLQTLLPLLTKQVRPNLHTALRCFGPKPATGHLLLPDNSSLWFLPRFCTRQCVITTQGHIIVVECKPLPVWVSRHMQFRQCQTTLSPFCGAGHWGAGRTSQ